MAKREPRHGPFTADEQRALDAAICAGRVTRIENGPWDKAILTRSKVVAGWFAALLEPE